MNVVKKVYRLRDFFKQKMDVEQNGKKYEIYRDFFLYPLYKGEISFVFIIPW